MMRQSFWTKGLFLCCRYAHDDSETSEDQVKLLVTDGVNTAEALMNIQVASMDILLSRIHPSIHPSFISLSVYLTDLVSIY